MNRLLALECHSCGSSRRGSISSLKWGVPCASIYLLREVCAIIGKREK
jgi:hypothetical protein